LWALKDIGFSVDEGDTLGIIGRNGAGKSTLLKILSRITKPTKGSVRIRGRVGSLLEVGTGFHSELSGRENIYLNGAILGMHRSEIDRKFDEIVAFSEIEEFLDTPVKHYSSGMYMRLAFSVAAHLEPEVLMVDEVLAVGDAIFQNKCLGKMDEVSRSGRTVLFVSHNLGSLAQICNKGLLLHKGELRSFGDIRTTIDDYLTMSGQETEFSIGQAEVDPDLNISGVRVINRSGCVTGEVPHDEEFYVSIDLNARKFRRERWFVLRCSTNISGACLRNIAVSESCSAAHRATTKCDFAFRVSSLRRIVIRFLFRYFASMAISCRNCLISALLT